jgi:hypothetical protein
LGAIGVLFDSFSMLPSVDFHDKTGLLAQKVDNVSAKRNLSPEFPALKPPGAQVVPEPSLRIGQVRSKLLRIA